MSATTRARLIHEWLAQVARSEHADDLVLRGSLVTAHFCPARIAADVDHLALDPLFDEAKMRARVEAIAPPLEVRRQEVIWPETPFPGLRAIVGRGEADLQIDVGFGDPLTIPPARISIGGVSILAVRPETMFGWKVHGLFEHGRGKWRPKDLFDLWLYLEHVDLDEAALVASVRTAFASRATPLELTAALRDDAWGKSRGSQRKWEWLRRQEITNDPFPDFETVLGRVKASLLPLLARATARRPRD